MTQLLAQRDILHLYDKSQFAVMYANGTCMHDHKLVISELIRQKNQWLYRMISQKALIDSYENNVWTHDIERQNRYKEFEINRAKEIQAKIDEFSKYICQARHSKKQLKHKIYLEKCLQSNWLDV